MGCLANKGGMRDIVLVEGIAKHLPLMHRSIAEEEGCFLINLQDIDALEVDLGVALILYSEAYSRTSCVLAEKYLAPDLNSRG